MERLYPTLGQKSGIIACAALFLALGFSHALAQDALTWSGTLSHTPSSTTLESWNWGTDTLSIGQYTDSTSNMLGALTISAASVSGGTLSINYGTVSLLGGQLKTNGHVYVAQAGATASFLISGSGLGVVATNLNFGYSSAATGTVSIRDGGSLTATGSALLGFSGNATMLVSGSTSKAIIGTAMHLGYTRSASGTVQVLDGGTLSHSGYTYLAFSGSGKLLVSGAGSNAIIKGTLTVGGNSASAGIISIQDGGALTLGSTTIVGNYGNGTLIISGSGSSAIVESPLYFGYYASGTGTLSVQDGAALSVARAMTIGSSGTGIVSLSGGTSVFENTVDVRNGTLAVSNKTDGVSVGRTLTVSADSTLRFDIDLSAPLSETDAVLDAQSVALDTSGTYIINIADIFGELNARIFLLDVTNSVDAAMKSIAWTILGADDPRVLSASTQWDGNKFFLNISTIPEPAATAALLSCAMLALALRKRRG